ncbi:hypothetical protein L210DRAFT_3730379, partial [Boletus edulis BED1]
YAQVWAAKYSPKGNRIATATNCCVRVWRSNDGRLLVEIPVKVTPEDNTGLLWFSNHLFVVSDNAIKQFHASSGSPVAEWQVPSSNAVSCIALPKHGQFIAYSTNNTVTLWYTSTHAQLSIIQHTQGIRSIAFSPDDQFLAIGGGDGKVCIKSLSRIINVDSIPPSCLHRTFRQPDIETDDVALHAWKHDQLENADALLTTAISTSQRSIHHLLASRALVRTRLQLWDAALIDAAMAINIQPTPIGFIAKGLAHVGKGERHKGYRTCDIASEHLHSSHHSFLFLTKAIIVFMAGEHPDAISRLDDLIATFPSNSLYHTVQAYMYLLHGNSQMELSDYEGATHSFQRARAQSRSDVGPPLFAISLISGWKFDNLDITIRQCLCEALYAMGRTMDAGESLLEIVNALDEKAYNDVPITKWISDFTQQYLSTFENDGHAASNPSGDGDPRRPHATVNSQTPILLLREWAKAILASGEWRGALVASANFVVPRFAIYQVMCERLEATSRIVDAVECFHEMTRELGGGIYMSGFTIEWVCDFIQRRLCVHGDATSNANQYSSTPTIHTTLTPLLELWAKAKLTSHSWKAALLSAVGFTLSRFEIYRVVCEHLEAIDRVADAVECFHAMTSDLGVETLGTHDEQLAWALDLRQRASEKLERLGDMAVDVLRYDDAISHYSSASSPISSSPKAILLKRSKAWLATGSWKQALQDANQVIMLDPSSPWGYEIKHAALHKGGDYDNAIRAFEMMLSKMAESRDPGVQRQGDKYVSPSSTQATIRKVVERTLRRSPHVLINTTTGRLHDRTEQASAFESLPIFKELVSSMTTRIDYVRIKHEVRQYFRYVMLSHKWEDKEPLFQQVVHLAVYELETSSTHDKLQTFCKIVQDAGFNWAWSDTCCIDKSDHFVLQEALVAMFRWYQGSAMVIVFLRGVRPSSPRGALARSIWNTRAWTLQEYIAAKVIRFYTEDWTLYRDLEMPNHKESPEIISEMEQVTGVSAQQLMTLRPGLGSIREKLRLASTRRTTRVEDAAYSLLGIFSAIGIPPMYGEGEEASLGRLLANVLTRSGDASILAWTGESSRFNSCLPARISVFSRSHLLPPIPDSGMGRITGSYIPSFNLGVAWRLYNRLKEIPTPRFAESRMTLPCIAFPLLPLSTSRTGTGRVYHVDTNVFGRVEIRIRQDLCRMKSLYLVHPWLEALLQHENTDSGAFVEDDEEIFGEDTDDEESDDINDSSSLPEPELPPPIPIVAGDRAMCTRRLVAHLRQPFGALLLTPTGRRATDYKRVAADSLIVVRFQDSVPLDDILDHVRVLDVL